MYMKNIIGYICHRTNNCHIHISYGNANARSEGAKRKLEQGARANGPIQNETTTTTRTHKLELLTLRLRLSQFVGLRCIDTFTAIAWKRRVFYSSRAYCFKKLIFSTGFLRHFTTYSKQLTNFKVISPIIKKIMKPQVVFVLGGPGAGKGTQCQKIVQEFGFEHLSAGDLLREERARPNSEFGELIEKHIREGSIVPVEITCSLLERAMQKSSSNKFLIDGFPRNKNNLDGWTERVAPNVSLLFVLFFDCSSEVCEKRCLDRGAAGSGRVDDNIESLRKRFNTYINDTMPIIEYYQEKNLVQKIDASKSPDEVFADVKQAFNSLASGDS